MKRLLRFAIVLIAALALVPLLPLYIERTMLRSWRVDRVGDVIEWGWRLRTLTGFWSDYRYFKSEQHPAFWLGVNLALAFAYALVIAIIIDWFLMRRARNRSMLQRAAFKQSHQNGTDL